MFIVPTLIAVAATTAVAIAVGTHHTPRHDTVVTTHSDVALPPDYASVSAADLAQRSFAIPGMKQAIVGVVVDELGSQQIGSGTDEDPTRIVTDYKMSVATAIAASGVVPASGTVTVRIPGGSIGSDSGRSDLRRVGPDPTGDGSVRIVSRWARLDPEQQGLRNGVRDRRGRLGRQAGQLDRLRGRAYDGSALGRLVSGA
jgi:hypothetical protein